ncbi:MAG: NAD(P)H-binding protein, partial [Byssovorax sp.]
MRPRVLVTGASGNVGREVVRALRARGVAVRAAASSSAPREALGDDVETVKLDLRDPGTFAGAVQGCSALFLLRPPAIADTKRTLNPFIDAARAGGIGPVVFLSVAGAEKNKIVPHHAVEAHLIARGGDFTLLRPGFFAQNFGDAYRRDLAEDDRIFVPAGDGLVTFVDARDLGEVA